MNPDLNTQIDNILGDLAASDVGTLSKSAVAHNRASSQLQQLVQAEVRKELEDLSKLPIYKGEMGHELQRRLKALELDDD